MSGVSYCIGMCAACDGLVIFNPDTVPSIRVRGKREPLCLLCAREWNRIHRTERGLPPVEIPETAYVPGSDCLWENI